MSSFRFKKNMEIGKLEAETDSFLNHCFYESDVFNGLLNFDNNEGNPDFTRRIIVGRTGSGKTALLKQIIQSNKIKVHETIEAENTVFEHIKNNVFITNLISKGVDLRAFYKSLWLHILLVNVINQLHRSNYESFFDRMAELVKLGKKPYNAKLANEYLTDHKDNFFNDHAISEITKKVEDGISLSVGINETKASADNKKELAKKIQSETSSYVSRELLRKQKELIKALNSEYANSKQVKIIISIDDLDKSWLSGSEIRYDFINALLEAFRELLDIKSVKILISIRTDIIMGIYKNSFRQQEKDESLIYSISWNKKEIIDILDMRINRLIRNQYSSSQTVAFCDVFHFTVQGEKATDYIIDRTMLRPRDAIAFVNLCLAECDGEVELNENIVLEAEEKFYSTRKSALATEWATIFPHISEYLDALSFIRNQTFNLESLPSKEKDQALNFLVSKNNIGDDEAHNNRVVNFEELVKLWFCVGVIGIKKSTAIVVYSSFQKPELDITDLRHDFIVHPLYFR